MYLIHARFRAPDDLGPPDAAAALFTAHALPEERLEHVAAHPDADGRELVVGLFVSASCVEAAERAATAICHRTLDRSQSLRDFVLQGCGVGLVAKFYDRMLAESDPAGRSMPGPDQSNPDYFRLM